MLETAIHRLSLGADMERRPTSTLRWKSGLALEALEHSDVSRGEVESLVRNGHSTGQGASAYSQFNWSPNPKWLMEGGLRLDHWFDSGTSTSPRIAIKRFLGDGRWAVRLDAGRYVQFLQSVRDESLPIALDSWVLAGNEVSPVVSRQFQGGLEGFFGADDEWFASAAGYHRGYEGLAARNWADDPGVRSDDFKTGTGRSYGAEFLLRRNRGATTGWVSVSLLKATRKFPQGADKTVPLIEYPPRLRPPPGAGPGRSAPAALERGRRAAVESRHRASAHPSCNLLRQSPEDDRSAAGRPGDGGVAGTEERRAVPPCTIGSTSACAR